MVVNGDHWINWFHLLTSQFEIVVCLSDEMNELTSQLASQCRLLLFQVAPASPAKSNLVTFLIKSDDDCISVGLLQLQLLHWKHTHTLNVRSTHSSHSHHFFHDWTGLNWVSFVASQSLSLLNLLSHANGTIIWLEMKPDQCRLAR